MTTLQAISNQSKQESQLKFLAQLSKLNQKQYENLHTRFQGSIKSYQFLLGVLIVSLLASPFLLLVGNLDSKSMVNSLNLLSAAYLVIALLVTFARYLSWRALREIRWFQYDLSSCGLCVCFRRMAGIISNCEFAIFQANEIPADWASVPLSWNTKVADYAKFMEQVRRPVGFERNE